MGMMFSPQIRDAPFGLEAAGTLLTQLLGNWVQDLGLLVESAESMPPPGAPASWQPGAVVRLPYSPKICRDGFVCEQALMSLADSAMLVACAAAWHGYRPTTGLDQTTHFLRAVSCDVLADARVLRVARDTCFGQVTLLSAWDRQIVGTATLAYVLD